MTAWTDSRLAELMNLFHLARTALAGDPEKRSNRHEWQKWAARAYHESHPEVLELAAYKQIDREEAWRY